MRRSYSKFEQQFELRSFGLEDGCAHFSDGVRTPDLRPGIYIATCDGSNKNRISFITRCMEIELEMADISDEIKSLQAELQHAAGGMKAQLIAQIKQLIQRRTVLSKESKTLQCKK